MNNEEVEQRLTEAVAAYRSLPKRVDVPKAIKAITGKDVIPLDGDDADMIASVVSAAERMIADSQTNFIQTRRLNELGNSIEETLLNSCITSGIDASWPKRADGTGGRSGYPDIVLDVGRGRPTYLEAKVVGPNQEKSTFRSFYMSPSDNPKVCFDARHLLLAFEHERRENSTNGMEQYSLNNFKLVDLAHVWGKVKFEYQTSNKELYLLGALVASG